MALCMRCWQFLHDRLLHGNDVGEAEEAPGLLRRTVNFDGDLHDAVPVRGAPGDRGPRQRNGKVATWQAFPRPMLALHRVVPVTETRPILPEVNVEPRQQEVLRVVNSRWLRAPATNLICDNRTETEPSAPPR